MVEELLAQIKVVAEARKVAELEAEAKKSAYKQWEEDYSIMLGMVAESMQAVVDAEALLRELTLKAYAETGEKAPAVGVSVKIFEVLRYDKDEAMKWGVEHRIALKLDTLTFEKIAKVEGLEFVTITEEPQAQIAQNLDKE
ncbi:hypothetical protein LCGC14_1745660 [marine sediment metagenome]|uniref:Uncharacterized protein n=1 Tax=marine sediment metagenome TaxID=412755 RepID=A0A0F9K4Y3_9ZZZZ